MIHKQIRQHAAEIFRIQRQPIPWTWMITTGMATLVPMLCGLLRNDEPIAIFGALAGYFIGLTDHPGTLKNRILMAVLTALSCWLSCVAGLALQDHVIGFAVVSAAIVYLLGLYGGRGAEFERMILLAALEFFVVRYARALPFASLPQLEFYFGLAFAVACFAIVMTRLTLQRKPGQFLPVRQAMTAFATMDYERHMYALMSATAILTAIFIVEYFQIDRGYWAIITVLLMVKPDRKDTLYRMCQRIFGTLLGVGIGEILLMGHVPMGVFIAIVFICATLVPYVWLKNYWLVAFGATMMVISLLSIAQYGHIDPSIGLLRIEATLGGCLISILVILTFRFIERLISCYVRPR